ncbi:MAG: DNA cytosine methyltransferase [Candidatus Altimarinota bacterium]
MHKNKANFSFIDLFAGIGGFRIALENLGGKCIGFSEIDKEATNTYKANFQNPTEIEFGSITNLDKLPQCDVLVGGVPCQSWSVAGKMRGFEDPRGQLWFDTIRLVKTNRPKAFIFENVKGLSDPRNQANLDIIISELTNCGYNVSHKVQNTYDFGLPQNRERIFLVGIRNDLRLMTPFQFPESNNLSHPLHEFLDNLEVLETKKQKLSPSILFGGKVPFSRNKFQKTDELNDFFTLCDTRNGHSTIHSWDIIQTSNEEKELCLTILKNRRKKIYGDKDGNPMSFSNLKELIPNLERSVIEELIKKGILRKTKENLFDLVNSKNSAGINNIYRIYLPNSHIFSTLTATGTKDFIATKQITGTTPKEYKQNFIKEILSKKNYRQITVSEAKILQGFPQTFNPHENYRVAMKQFGNAVSVPVVEQTMLSVIKTGAFLATDRNQGLISNKSQNYKLFKPVQKLFAN